jgi:hypothetical protein
MAILVSDSSVLIDLERGGLLQVSFFCGHTLIVPDLLYETELHAYNGPYLKNLGLSVVSLTPDEVGLAQDIANGCPALSLEDCFALALAARAEHTLLAGDGPLRNEASSRKIACSGLLWFLDQILVSGAAKPVDLCAALMTIAKHPRCRLPKLEVEKRLKSWC